MYTKSFILAFIALFNLANAGKCPSTLPPIGAPCLYEEYDIGCSIVCAGDKDVNIAPIFADLKPKLPANVEPFTRFKLNSSAISELPANVFSGVPFAKMHIQNAYALKRVHRLAFNGTEHTIQVINFSNSPVSERVVDDWDLFGAIRLVNGLRDLVMSTTALTSLPSMSISNLPKLSTVEILYHRIQPVATHAFHNLPSLQSIAIRYGRLEFKEHAFTVGRSHNSRPLQILFPDESLSDDSFTKAVFDGIGRPATISLDANSVSRLYKAVFNSFLADNPLNTVYDRTFNCSDTQNNWVSDKYQKVWYDLNCPAKHRGLHFLPFFPFNKLF